MIQPLLTMIQLQIHGNSDKVITHHDIGAKDIVTTYHDNNR
jgi:hypothetical protein